MAGCIRVLHNDHIWKSGEVVTENQKTCTRQGGLPGQVHPQGDQPWFPWVLLVNKHGENWRKKEKTSRSNLDHSWLIGQDIRFWHVWTVST